MSALDTILTHMQRIEAAAAGVLILGKGRWCGPGPGALLLHSVKTDLWEFPSSIDDVGNTYIDGAQFEPALDPNKYDDFNWTHPDFALTCDGTSPKAAAAIKQFLADSGDRQATGEQVMDSAKDFFDAQVAAEQAYRAFGDSAPARMQGESLADYEGRLTRPHQPHSKQFKDADVSKIGCTITRRAVAAQIYCDAAAAFNSGATVPAGQSRPVRERNPAGVEITRYVGHIAAFMDQFNQPVRHVRNPMWLRVAPGR
jgi:hypothetical protein